MTDGGVNGSSCAGKNEGSKHEVHENRTCFQINEIYAFKFLIYNYFKLSHLFHMTKFLAYDLGNISRNSLLSIMRLFLGVLFIL